MITLLIIEREVLKAFKTTFKSVKTAKTIGNGFRSTEVRYLIYYMALQYNVSVNELEKRYQKHRTNIRYGEGIATDLLSYNKDYRAKHQNIKIQIDNIILNNKP